MTPVRSVQLVQSAVSATSQGKPYGADRFPGSRLWSPVYSATGTRARVFPPRPSPRRWGGWSSGARPVPLDREGVDTVEPNNVTMTDPPEAVPAEELEDEPSAPPRAPSTRTLPDLIAEVASLARNPMVRLSWLPELEGAPWVATIERLDYIHSSTTIDRVVEVHIPGVVVEARTPSISRSGARAEDALEDAVESLRRLVAILKSVQSVPYRR